MLGLRLAAIQVTSCLLCYSSLFFIRRHVQFYLLCEVFRKKYPTQLNSYATILA